MPETNFGALGVKIFFVVSGFLVTQSWLARESVGPSSPRARCASIPRLSRRRSSRSCSRACRARLRGRVSRRPADDRLRVARGARLGHASYRLPGASRRPFPHDVNGSLWTLPIELRLYVVLLVAGFLGILARRARRSRPRRVGGGVRVRPEWFPLAPNDKVVRELGAALRAGLARLRMARGIPISLAGATAAAVLVAWNPAGLRAASCSRRSSRTSCWSSPIIRDCNGTASTVVGDYSYGLYVYSFPLQQTLMQRLPSLEPAGLFACSLPLGLAVAALSWHALEAPALALKSRFDEAKARHDSSPNPARDLLRGRLRPELDAGRPRACADPPVPDAGHGERSACTFARRSIACSPRTCRRPSRCRVTTTPRWTAGPCDSPTLPHGDTELRRVGESFAGKPCRAPLGPGEIVRIFTGGVMPRRRRHGGDAGARERHDGRVRIAAGAVRKAGQNRRFAGEDMRRGAGRVPPRPAVGPAELGMIASLGIDEVTVFRRLRVAFFSTGDELRRSARRSAPGEIYDSNRYTHLRHAAAAELRRAGHGRGARRARGAGACVRDCGGERRRRHHLRRRVGRRSRLT